MMVNKIHEFVLENMRTLADPERPVFLVGGAVRDLLLNNPVHDLDFVMAGETHRFAKEVARRLDGALYILDEERGTTRVVLEQQKLGGKPGERLLLDFSVLRGKDIYEDLRARDFTINAMAFDVSRPGFLVDSLGGMTDLREKRIRICSPDSLISDPVRVLRAVRQAVQFGFRIDSDTLRQMRSAVSLLPAISPERVRDELFRMLSGPQVSLSFRLLDRVNALVQVLPELEVLKGVEQSAPHQFDVWEHTLRVLQYLEQLLSPLVGQYLEETVTDLTVGSAVLWLGRYRDFFQNHLSENPVSDRNIRGLLFLAALYHDISKPTTRNLEPGGKVRFLQHQELGVGVIRERARNLAFSTHESRRLEMIVRHHMRVHFMANSLLAQKSLPSRKVIYRFFRDTEAAGVDICLLSLADLRGTYGMSLPQEVWESELEVCRHLLEGYWEKKEEVVSPPRLLSGHDIMKDFGLKPGKRIGLILGMIREAQAMGEIGSREEANAFVSSWLEKHLDQADLSTDIGDDKGEAEE